ncbi:unnamed protein product [Dibothriocephalus latus]|uniref:Uncharacterized protein n=1 Tax=Dibothriocephalus latus TaxID=60516 RepID=A0A3P7QN75_DIBLA|nr:unnamed protein product [Dibothriocephalus latus]
MCIDYLSHVSCFGVCFITTIDPFSRGSPGNLLDGICNPFTKMKILFVSLLAINFGIALPKWMIKKENNVLVVGAYALVFMFILPLVVVSL